MGVPTATGKTGSKFYVLRVPRTSFLVAGTFLIQNMRLTPFSLPPIAPVF